MRFIGSKLHHVAVMTALAVTASSAAAQSSKAATEQQLREARSPSCFHPVIVSGSSGSIDNLVAHLQDSNHVACRGGASTGEPT